MNLKLNREKKEKIEAKIKSYLLIRKNNQEISLPSAGCIFKNPVLDSDTSDISMLAFSSAQASTFPDKSFGAGPDASIGAGRLIDLCGFKGKSIGGALVSEKHANFIVNKGGARSEDVLKLMKLIRQEIKAQFKLILQPEIKIWQ